jgi:hypothetical protein
MLLKRVADRERWRYCVQQKSSSKSEAKERQ